MIALFAHHIEAQHIPVLTAFFAVGVWLGWHVLSLWASRTGKTKPP